MRILEAQKHTDPDPKHWYIYIIKIKSHKEVTKQNTSRFFLLILLDVGRIREVQKHTDPDPNTKNNIGRITGFILRSKNYEIEQALLNMEYETQLLRSSATQHQK
jgi:hypothetical protein